MDDDESTTLICTILTMEQSCFSYKACSNCETVIPESSPLDFVCNSAKCKGRRYRSKRFFRLLQFSIATDTKVINVVCFDKAAKVIFGCSAQEFFDFTIQHPYAEKYASNALEGELFRVTLNKPKRVKADHLRMTNIVPLRTGFVPVIKTLEELYKAIYENKAA